MWSRIIIYIMGAITGRCYGEKVYTNNCGTVSLAEPVIDGKRMLFTFVPENQTDISEGGVTWKYSYGNEEYEFPNITRYNMTAYNSSFTLDLMCIKDQDRRREYSALFSTSTGGCRSLWFNLTVLDAPTNCGILYRQPKHIKNADEVIMEYYAPDYVLKSGEYVRILRRKNLTDCEQPFGCAVDVTWFVEEYSDYNSVYVYRIRNFTDGMNGNYSLYCTNRTDDKRITNTVRLVIPVAPQTPTFLNTKDIDDNEDCIAGKDSELVNVQCRVEGGTSPVFVKMYTIDVFQDKLIWECTFYEENVTMFCEWRLRLSKDFHLRGIRCEVSNEATARPIATTAMFYVIVHPNGPHLDILPQTEGRDIDIKCRCWGGQPTPELGMIVDGEEINSTLVSMGKSYSYTKLSYLLRNWNGATLKCCMQHLYYDEPKCSDNKKVNYQFSPESTEIYMLPAATSDRKTLTHTLQCTVINANPACNVNWTYPSTLQVVIGAENETKPAGQGGFTTTSTLQFNGTRLINSPDIYCQPVCGLFSVTSMAKYTILIPYAPIITTNASKDTIWNIGDTVMIKCYADSFPLANLSWFDTDNNTMATSNCGKKAKCMEIKNVQMTDAGIYTCLAETELFDTVNQTVELAIRSTRKHDKEKITIPWITVGIAASLLMAVLAVIIAVVIVTKRRKGRQIETATENNVFMDVLSQNSRNCKEIGIGSDSCDSLQDVTNTSDDTNPTNRFSKYRRWIRFCCSKPKVAKTNREMEGYSSSISLTTESR